MATTADLVVSEVRVIGKGADDSVSPVLVGGAVAVVPEWWVSVAFAAALFVACCVIQ